MNNKQQQQQQQQVESSFESRESGDDSYFIMSSSPPGVLTKKNNNSTRGGGGGVSDNINDNNSDVYAQLDEFEHLLDVELENMTKLGFLDGSSRCASTTAAATSARRQISVTNGNGSARCSGDDSGESVESDSDSCGITNDYLDTDNINIDRSNSESDDDEIEERLTLLPPPSSWFDGNDNIGHTDVDDIKADGKEEDHANSAATDDDDQHTEKQYNPSSATTNSAAATTTTDHNNPTTSAAFNATISSTSKYETMLSQITSLSTTTTTISIATSLLTSLISQTNLPTILHEISTSVLSRGVHKLRIEYTNLMQSNSIGPNRYKRASDIGNANGRGYYCPEDPILLSSSMSGKVSSSLQQPSAMLPQFVVYRHPRAVSESYYRSRGSDDVNNDNIVNNNLDNERNSSGMDASGTETSRDDINTRAMRDDQHPDSSMRTWDGTEVRFTSLSWIERQLVREWRTYEWKREEDEDKDDGEMMDKKEVEDDANANSKRDNGSLVLFSDDGRGDSGGTDDSDCHEYATSDHVRHRRRREEQKQQCDDESSDNTEIDVNDDENEEDPLFDIEEDEFYYDRARTMAPRPLPRPMFEKATSCYTCRRIFGPALHRHHCRRCGHSYCHAHSNLWHKLPHLGYSVDVPERVCRKCKAILDDRDLEERVSWRLARCRDLLKGELTPYFETGVDTVEDAAYRLTRLAITFARAIPLGAQAYVAVETAEVLRKHGLKGVYGLLLRKEFLAAADLLCRVLGINRTNWPLSVHELSAAIFYALAQHRALRGLRPDGEELIHSLRPTNVTREGATCVHDESNVFSTEGRPMLDAVVEDVNDDIDAGDTIEWAATSHKCLVEEVSESVLDETDVYDPLSEQVVDLLAMSTSNPLDASSRRRRCKNGHAEVVNGVDGSGNDKGDASSGDTTSAQNTAPFSKLPFEPVCEHVPDTLISSLLFYAPLALEFIYAECEVDMQLLGAQQGWRLVFASLDQNHHDSHTGNKEGTCLEGDDHFSDRPAAALFAHDERKIACLSIRGTATIQDVVTDIRAMPVPFPQQQQEDGDCARNNYENEDWTPVFRGSGLALCGMAGAAANLFRETVDPLLYLALNGYKIRIVGHSLGGGVAALLGILLLRHFEKQGIDTKRSISSTSAIHSDDGGFVHVYSYGTPSCVDARLADYPRTLSLCTSVVLHDDVVPRLTPTSVRGLLKHLLYIRETWVKTHLSDDLNAITERAYHAWPNRLRGSFTLLKKKGVASAKRLKKSCEKRIQGETVNSTPAINDSNEDDISRSRANSNRCTPQKLPMLTEAELSDEGPNIGSIDGLDVEGDLFFDTLGDPLNESDDESSVEVPRHISSSRRSDSEWVPFDEPPIEEHNELSCTDQNEQTSSDADTYPQMLEEMPLPRMYIPGKIVHIYTHRGGYKAAFVPRKFRSLRRVSMAGNMLSDHMASRYYEGLLEVKAIRAAKQDLPSWVGFADDCTCSCCASLFTWASTSHTEAQAARDKHNCRACGGLVCDPCSKRRIPIPSIGITAPVRVCDRCYNGWGTLYGANDNLQPSSWAGTRARIHSFRSGGANKSPVSRRSVVVDELASRIPSIT